MVDVSYLLFAYQVVDKKSALLSGTTNPGIVSRLSLRRQRDQGALA
jgi:hypothetical protein